MRCEESNDGVREEELRRKMEETEQKKEESRLRPGKVRLEARG